MSKEQLLAEIQEKFQNNQIYELRSLAEKAILKFPNDAFGYYYLGECAIYNWEYSQAVDFLKKASELDANNSTTLRRLGFAQFKAQDEAAAVLTWEGILKNNPNDADTWIELGRYYANSWDSEKAKKAPECLSKALELRPTASELYLDRARAYQMSFEYEKALQDVNKCIEQLPNHIDAYLARISIYSSLGQYEPIAADYKKMTEITPEESSYWINWGTHLLQQKEFAQAEPLFSQSIAINAQKGYPISSDYFHRAEARMGLGNYTAALEDFNKALEIYPDQHDGHRQRALAKKALGDKEGFLQDISLAMSKSTYPTAELLEERARFYVENQQFTEAKDDYDAILNNPDLEFYRSGAYIGLGKMAQQQGDVKTAYNYWLKAKELYNTEADGLIEQYCGDVLAQAAQEHKTTIATEFADQAQRNAQSPILRKLFGHIWKIDLDLSLEKSPSINQLPQGLVGFFMEAFRNITVSISESVILLRNPLNDNIEAYYRIEDETPDFVQIYGKPTNGKEPRTLRLSTENEYLKVSGLMSGAAEDSNAIWMYFRQATEADLAPEDRAAVEKRMKDLAQNFLGEFLTTIVDGFEKVFGASGEAASDDTPPENPAN